MSCIFVRSHPSTPLTTIGEREKKIRKNSTKHLFHRKNSWNSNGHFMRINNIEREIERKKYNQNIDHRANSQPCIQWHSLLAAIKTNLYISFFVFRKGICRSFRVAAFVCVCLLLLCLIQIKSARPKLFFFHFYVAAFFSAKIGSILIVYFCFCSSQSKQRSSTRTRHTLTFTITHTQL